MSLQVDRLSRLDNLLIKIKECNSGDIKSLRNSYFVELLICIGEKETENAEEKIFDDKLSAIEKKFVGICLIRLLCYRNEAIWEKKTTELRIDTFKLVKTINTELFKILRIDSTMENHDILMNLRTIEENFLGKIKTIKNKISDPRSASNVRKEFMQFFFLFQPYFEFFVDNSTFSKLRFDELFESLEDYNDSMLPNLLSCYNSFETKMSKFLRDSRHESNMIQTEFADLFQKISDTVNEHFKKSDLLKPADIKVLYLDRKYPLHLPDHKFDIKLLLRNDSIGCAFNVTVTAESDEVLIMNNIINYGSINPGTIVSIVLEGCVLDNVVKETSELMITLGWLNFNKEPKTRTEVFVLKSQNKEIDWDTLVTSQPYSLEAIDTETELVGRNEIIQKIRSKLGAKRIESVIIHGQKRVGKTSIANVLRNMLRQLENFLVISLNVGDLNKSSAEKFINDLGNYVFDSIKKDDRIRLQLSKPRFDGAISPLLTLFRDLHSQIEDLKIVIIIDEFDEIPSELYKYSEIGETFFHNLRSLSKESFVGFVLVGSENIELIKQSSEMINKFANFKVDYFDKENFWNDFQDLVKRPVTGSIEFEDSAINKLFETTEGNPFYTNLICSEAFELAVQNRSSYITEDDIEKAISSTVAAMGANHTNHFWKDGIDFVEKSKIDLIETQRRKFLIGFSSLEIEAGKATRKLLIEKHKFKDSISLNDLAENFKLRGILLEEGESLRVRPRIFDMWLKERGYNTLKSGFLDEEITSAAIQKDQQVYVKDLEISELVKKWSTYNGKKVSLADVRLWLDQFETNVERRLMFKILSNVTFYSEELVLEKLKIIHKEVNSMIKRSVVGKEQSQREILLTSIANPAKSNSIYLRKYANTNKVLIDNVINFDKLNAAVKRDERVQAIVTIDDIIGTGTTQCELLSENIKQETIDLIVNNNLKLLICTICATKQGIEKVRRQLDKFPFESDIICADLLTERDKCFSDDSEIFDSSEEKNNARNIAFKYGRILNKRFPLGYDDSSLAIVFFENCPNNSLPILSEKREKEPKWIPIFERKHLH